jgi:hypothetical protein
MRNVFEIADAKQELVKSGMTDEHSELLFNTVARQ